MVNFQGSLQDLRPFIKSKGKKVFFCASKIRTLKDGILTNYDNQMVGDGRLFCFWGSYTGTSSNTLSPEGIEIAKGTTYIFEDLYYKRGAATYFLDRQFIILCK